MKMQYFFAIIEVDSDKLDPVTTGPELVEEMKNLKTLIDKCGACTYYQITDVDALRKFRKELERLNP